MSALEVGLLILLLVIVAGLTAVLLILRAFAHRGTEIVAFRVDANWYEIPVQYEDPLVKRLKALGLAIWGHIGTFWPKSQVKRVDLAHELLHIAREITVGRLRYTVQALGEAVLQKVWRRRSTEEEARRGERALAMAEHGTTVMVAINGRLHEVECPRLQEFSL